MSKVAPNKAPVVPDGSSTTSNHSSPGKRDTPGDLQPEVQSRSTDLPPAGPFHVTRALSKVNGIPTVPLEGNTNLTSAIHGPEPEGFRKKVRRTSASVSSGRLGARGSCH